MTAQSLTDQSPLRPRRQADVKRRSNFWPLLFIVTLALPVSYYIGPMRLSPYRIVLMLTLFPCIYMWLSGQAGKIRSFDIYLVLHLVWATISYFVTTEFTAAIEPAGMLIIETLGAYLLARCYVRDIQSFRTAVKWFFFIVAFLLPFAAAEAIFNQPVLYNIFRLLGEVTPTTDMEMRMGMRRAQGSLEHPILFGVFCSAAVSLAYYCVGAKAGGFSGLMRAMAAFLAAFFSLSTGAYLSAMVQLIMIGWDRATRWLKGRWKVLAGLFVFAYVFVDALSNRTPFEVFVSYLTFNQHNSYNRVLIWEFGIQQVAMTPIFGMGISQDWFRPWWMSPSMDNFWLVITVRNGIPAFIFFAMVIISMSRQILKLDLEEGEINNARKGLMITIVGLVFAICSVHLWNAAYVLFIFLIGCGPWLIDYGTQNTDQAKSAAAKHGETRHA